MYGAAPQGLNAASICRRHHRLQLFDHAKLDKDTRLLGRDRNVEHPGEGIPLQMRQPPGAVRLIRLHQARTRRRSAALRIAFDQGHEAALVPMLDDLRSGWRRFRRARQV